MKLWIDFDPGGLVYTGLDVDDDLALIFALSLQQLGKVDNILGISVVGGNAPLVDTCENGKRLLNYIGKSNIMKSNIFDTPIPCGVSWNDMNIAWPSFQKLHMFRPDVSSSDQAALSMIDAIHVNDINSLTILILGPPSNLALAMKLDPTIINKIGRVVLMGGSLDAGRYFIRISLSLSLHAIF
jgi:purine nucleosidase